MRINLHIDRLVLHGIELNRDQRSGLRLAVEDEVRQRLGDNGAMENLREADSRSTVRAGEIRNEETTTPENLGNQIGAAVVKGIRR